ncbi:hypothetical protein C7R93_29695 [Brevibacillus fortis]|uniref:Aminotransferase class I/classII large domain-containing protein n=1 Tax=Brevibacillus fortis TaxID=2126352 RepID=A0A2P7UEY7_9BACL|nr:hypothetical protein C7R93_29695 [Brevibacillus fortis]
MGVSKQALSFLCLLLADRHRVVAIEEPGYADARIVFSHHGYEVVPIPLAEEGLSIEALEKSEATVVYTTPAHQFPYGMVMPVGQRQQLLQWAKRKNGIIIENDYDGEFRYNVHPTPSLQGMDRDGCVVYIGNFSKAFSPALRLDYTVLPRQLLGRYLESFQAYPSPVSRHLQRSMQLFMQKGYWEKHVRKMRTVYHRKHDALLRAIQTTCPGKYAYWDSQQGYIFYSRWTLPVQRRSWSSWRVWQMFGCIRAAITGPMIRRMHARE